jgi:hypothetical protein
MTMMATATTTIPTTARKKYALRSGFPRRLSALALMTAHTSGHPIAARRSTTPPGKGRRPDATVAAMTPKTAILDLFIGRDGDGWRLYVAPTSWKLELLERRMDERGEIFPVAAPDLSDLDRFMCNSDAPFERRPTTDGGMEILARGRSAEVLIGWLTGIVGCPPHLAN